MRETEQTAKTIEEAIEQGLHLLGATREQVSVEVLDEPSTGLFGIGGKQARVRVFVKELDVEKAKNVLEVILKITGLSGMVDVVVQEDSVRFEVSGEDLGVLIGHHGQTLNAIQFLLGVILSKGVDGRRVKCTVDVEGYRVRREKALQQLAERMARKASMERRSVTLEPMLPYERRIIHMALQNNPYVTTSSQGKEPLRKVVITPKEGGRSMPSRQGRPRSDMRRTSGRTRSYAGSRFGRERSGFERPFN